jgi:hypothetical protein
MTMADTTKSVAAEGDVTPILGTIPFTGAQSGTWTAGEITPTAHADLQVGGAAAISGASCTFSFKGVNSSGATVTGQEIVTLTAGATKLHVGTNAVLMDGDEATAGPAGFGNKLQVTSSRKLETS